MKKERRERNEKVKERERERANRKKNKVGDELNRKDWLSDFLTSL